VRWSRHALEVEVVTWVVEVVTGPLASAVAAQVGLEQAVQRRNVQVLIQAPKGVKQCCMTTSKSWCVLGTVCVLHHLGSVDVTRDGRESDAARKSVKTTVQEMVSAWQIQAFAAVMMGIMARHVHTSPALQTAMEWEEPATG